jgi:hypothetical protein
LEAFPLSLRYLLAHHEIDITFSIIIHHHTSPLATNSITLHRFYFHPDTWLCHATVIQVALFGI